MGNLVAKTLGELSPRTPKSRVSAEARAVKPGASTGGASHGAHGPDACCNRATHYGEMHVTGELGVALRDPAAGRSRASQGAGPQEHASTGAHGKRHPGRNCDHQQTIKTTEPFVPGGREPVLEVAWVQRHAHMLGDLRALLAPGAGKLPRKLRFYDSWRPRRYWAVYFSFSSLAHVLLIALPLPLWLAAARSANSPLELARSGDVELTWAGPVKTLPALAPKSPGPKKAEPSPAPAATPAPSAEAAPAKVDRFSRQTVMTNPARPNHPRQMLLQPAAAPEPPKILPELPNIVEWGRGAQPARPRIPISREVLARLRPKTRARRTAVEEAAPALPNQELRVNALSISSNAPSIPRPRMPVDAASVPRAAERRDLGESAAPDVGAAAGIPGFTGGGDDSARRVIALSASPAPPPPNLDLPSGNLSARVVMSPLGAMPGSDAGSLGANSNGNGPGGNGAGGTGGGAGGSGSGGGSGAGPAEVFIGSGDPSKTSNVVGPGGGSGLGRGSGLGGRGGTGTGGANPPRLSARDLAAGSGMPRVNMPEPPTPRDQALGPYAPPLPEDIVFKQRRVYSISVNMPNMTSVTGSWIVRFAELDTDPARPGRVPAGALASPEPIRKVDPKYPPALIEARIEGDVILYAIIRKDGTVDSVQVMKSLEPQLDQNAMQAFTRWQFWPAMRESVPVDIEAVVTIPFRAFVPR